MPSLADVQSRVARAVVLGDVDAVAGDLTGGADPRRRLGIHCRHYETSLTAALCNKYPATAWLAGAELVAAAAREYVHAHPPSKPCIAEYGGDFPAFVARYGRAAALPYLQSFAELEHAVGEVSIAIDLPPLPWSAVVEVGSERLLDLGLTLQPGVRYVCSAWGVDELMTMYMRSCRRETFVLPDGDTFVEIRGARGAVSLARVDAAAFTFRAALRAGSSIAAAAEGALERDAAFDAGAALRHMTQLGLVTGLSTLSTGAAP